jgi:chemotaxis protein methyltransferase CheR
MKTSTFEEISTLVYQQSGIDLPPGKAPLVSGRLGKRMRTLGLADEQAYLRYVLDDNSGEELVQLLDAISTNFTQFFREQDHFELLANEFRKRLKSGASPQFRIWSAACSSGEEPYSVAMTVDDVARSMGANLDQFKILATDISTRVLARAVAGQYHNREMNHVPAALRERFSVAT